MKQNSTPLICDALIELGGIMPMLHRLVDDASTQKLNRGTLGQIKVLNYIVTNRERHTYASDIARGTGVTPGAVSQTVAALVKKGIVERQGVPGEGHRLRIALTAYGKSLIARKTEEIVSFARRTFQDIPEGDQAVFARVVTLMHSRLKGALLARSDGQPPSTGEA